jgi:hypothetical protein
LISASHSININLKTIGYLAHRGQDIAWLKLSADNEPIQLLFELLSKGGVQMWVDVDPIQNIHRKWLNWWVKE